MFENSKQKHKLICICLTAMACLILAAGTSAQTPAIEQALSKLGYKVTGKISSAGADWELRDFNMREKQIITVKSKAKVPGEKNMYYRYSIRVEEFGSEADAEKRMEHIAATPPGPTSKMEAPEYALREGFRRGKLVYVVETVVYMFIADKSMSKFRAQLEDAIK